MAPLLSKEMKAVDISCNSPVSTAISTTLARLTLPQPNSSRTVLGRRIPQSKEHPWRPRTIMSSSVSRALSRTKSYTKKSTNETRRPASVDELSTTPGSSSRFLLNHDALSDVQHDGTENSVPAPLAPTQTVKLEALINSDEPAVEHVLKASDCSVNYAEKKEQVVVLRVSLHCKGCERKVRKHISKIEGVVSFDIDFATKKVTVIGDLTPSEVLDRISKFKYAQLWTSSPTLSLSS